MCLVEAEGFENGEGETERQGVVLWFIIHESDSESRASLEVTTAES